MKNLTNKTVTLIVGILVAVAIIFSYQSALSNLEVKEKVAQIGDMPVGTFGAPTHLLKFR